MFSLCVSTRVVCLGAFQGLGVLGVHVCECACECAWGSGVYLCWEALSLAQFKIFRHVV